MRERSVGEGGGYGIEWIRINMHGCWHPASFFKCLTYNFFRYPFSRFPLRSFSFAKVLQMQLSNGTKEKISKTICQFNEK